MARRRLVALVGALGLLAAATVPTAAQVEIIDWVDHTFGGGVQTFDLSAGGDAAADIALQPDGKVVTLAIADGGSPQARLVVLRFLTDGRPDIAFGAEGKAVLDLGGVRKGLGLALQPDGRIIAGGMVGNSGFAVARLDTDGRPDPTFRASYPEFGSQREIYPDFSRLALAPDGKVVVAGSLAASDAWGFVATRLRADGSIDEGFGQGGIAMRRTPTVDQPRWFEWTSSVTVGPDGSVLIGGTIGYFVLTIPLSNDAQTYSWFLLTKLTPAGALDPTFGDKGTVYTGFGQGSTARQARVHAITVQPDGKIVAAGMVTERNPPPIGSGRTDQALARYLPDGRLDPGFGAAGIVISAPPPSHRGGSITWGDARAWAVAVDGRGRILVGGDAHGFMGLDMAVSRYTPTGVLDPSFGRAGWMKIERDGTEDNVVALTVQPNGAAIFAGSVDAQFAIGRIASPDTSTTLRAWGWNGLGQLGDNSTAQRNLAVPSFGSSRAVAPAGGGFHSLTLRADGIVLASGWNGVGQLGDGTTRDRGTLAPVPGLDNVSYVAAGAHHSLAVRDGRVYAWGWNASGQLGDGTTLDRHTPVLVPGLTGVVEVAAGAYHSLARLNDGTIWAWGWNGVGQLGDGTTVDRHRPVQVPGMRSARAISAGALHSVAIASSKEWMFGGLWAWGWNAMGQSDPVSVGLHVIPSPNLIMPNPPIAIAAGGYHNLSIGSDGALYTWGWNAMGQLGHGTTTREMYRRVSAIPDPVRISAGGGHSMVTDTSGRTWAWGWNAMGQLGDGTTMDRSTPVLVPGLQGPIALSGGWYHSMGAVSGG